MKHFFSKPLLIVLGTALMLPVALFAQKEDKDKEKDKEEKEKNEIRQVIINRVGKNEKVIVEVNGDKVTVNGKPVDEYKGGDVTVRRKGNGDVFMYSDGHGYTGMNAFGGTGSDAWKVFQSDSINQNRAMLGVSTESADKGVEIQEITSKESGAAKAGLKVGDVITKVDDKKIESPDDLTKVIRSHKPGEKINITYLRDDKEQKTTAELGKWKGVNVFAATPDMNFDLGNMNYDFAPKMSMPRSDARGFRYKLSGGSPKLGLSVQDTDDGKGVKVIAVDDESNAEKAGLKEDDIITEVEGKAVNSADEVAKIIKESKDKVSVMVKLTRSGKTQNIEVKIPRKLKTADL
ncbi:MAG: PDZ domain-containing protein [Bacteroidetes bacterium]|nr:MAG: PDZ domain-containing protein [Bacteroidota bacterium]